MTEEDIHRAAVKDRVAAIVAMGTTDFHDVLSRSEGADPLLVREFFTEITGKAAAPTHPPRSTGDEVFSRLPASDPFRGQWWFTGESVDFLADRVLEASKGGVVLCLGTPTVGLGLMSSGLGVVVLDVDQHVIEWFDKIKPGAARCYDVADELTADLTNAFRIAVIDPPWYDNVMRSFIHRALAALQQGGELLCTLPPRLTRPDAERFRNAILRDLSKAGHEVLSLDRRSLFYVVPRFEEAALSRTGEFRAIPWRSADLLHVRKRGDAVGFPNPRVEKTIEKVFARDEAEFRVFLLERSSLDEHVVLQPLKRYSENVSTRAHVEESPDLWTTEKVGVRVGQTETIEAALRAWQARQSKEQTIRQLAERYKPEVVSNVVEELDEHLGLWSTFAAQNPLRTDDEIEKAKADSLTDWATPASERVHKEKSDKFRASYQRDRDRVLWSQGLRRLAHKTQLFPTEHDDQLRQRLAHSVEVMQLASTIGTSFGLDRDLIEAGALAHDIGHTPFGHAGEDAINKVLDRIHSDLGGFNHYEHGVDVVWYLEGPYATSRATPFHGLNLTPEVAECILKHTYWHTGADPLSATKLLERTKHPKIPGGNCHLEGQAVRIADKISYLVSDLEDGIRLGALSTVDLLSCSFFHRPPLSLKLHEGQTLYQRFIEQRGNILKILMEDVLVASNKRLARMKPADVRKTDDYTINHSSDLSKLVGEIWMRLQSGKLHKDRRVQLANLRAGRIVSDLTLALAAAPELIDENFSTEHSRLWGTSYLDSYKKRVGQTVSLPAALIDFLPPIIGLKRSAGEALKVPVGQLIQAKDYVAGLSDFRARALHNEIFGD